jgi:uncharacterized protein YbjQ (UPF0145 family)
LTDQPDDRNALKFVITTNDPVGYEVVEVLDEVSGISVRIWHVFSHICIAFRTLIGGEVKSWSNRLVEAKDDAIDRMCREAVQIGANAVIGLNVQVSGIAVCASGTAVRVAE